MIDTTGLDPIIKDPNMVTYCSLILRPGITAWITEIEFTMFKPDTDANDGFHVAIIKWPESVPLEYCVVVFEKRAQAFAESILWRNGLRKVTEGFTQMMMGGGKIEKFPIIGPNVFFLENHSKGASNVLYTNDPVKLKAAREHEWSQTQKFHDEHKRWLATEEGKATAEAFWKKHPEGRVR